MHEEWLKYAQIDLDSAEFLRIMKPTPIEVICYHCDEESEKLLKAVLVASNIEPPKTHDLIILCKKCTELDPSFESLSEACIELTPYGVQTRYPSNLNLSYTDMQCAIS